MPPSTLPPAVLLALGLSTSALADTADTGPCLSPFEDTGDTSDTGLGPCLSVPQKGCDLRDIKDGRAALALAPMLLLAARRRSRDEVLEALKQRGALPDDVAHALKGSDD